MLVMFDFVAENNLVWDIFYETIWMVTSKQPKESVRTIFTVGSLKSSRTETNIATASIAIKTSCSILTGVACTCQNF